MNVATHAGSRDVHRELAEPIRAVRRSVAELCCLALRAAVGGIPKRLSVEVLQRFPTTERTEPSAVQLHVCLYFSAVGPRVLT